MHLCARFQSDSASPLGYPKSSLFGSGYLLWRYLPRVLLPEQAAGYLLQRKPDQGVWRAAEDRLQPRVS